MPRKSTTALRLARIEADQAATRAALAGLEYRLGVHTEALDELQDRIDALMARTLGLEFPDLEHRYPIRKGADLIGESVPPPFTLR